MADPESGASADAPDPLFLNLVFMFQSAAWQHMGKVKNPVTDTIERDLEQARYAIDTLSMLETKTEGNRTQDEDKLLEHTLFELRMNFVEEKNKGDGPTESDPAEEEPEKPSEGKQETEGDEPQT